MQAWVRYIYVVGLAICTWVVLMAVQDRLDAPSRMESANLEILYSLSIFLSLPAIVIVGAFWTLIGRAATLERETLGVSS